ncbi:MAG: HEPN domain-containing protein, partial [Thermoproteota archaeon]
YPESISASQECIELSIKAIFLLLQKEYPKKHEFEEEEFEAILEKVPEKLKYLDFPKLYLYSKFWLSFYTVAKYGLEKIGIGPEKLFEREEAELALKHARRCYYAASQLESYVEHPQ